MDLPSRHKALLEPLRQAQADFSEAGVWPALAGTVSESCKFNLAFPFETLQGVDAFFEAAYEPLLCALPDLERRDQIVMAGATQDGAHCVGCAGFYCGTFARPWLGIPPTGHLVHMRFHEFYHFESGKVVEFQGLWDIPEVMMQAGAWPMQPSLGREWHIPGPATQDGFVAGPYDEALSAETRQHIVDMLTAMKRHPREPVEAMEMEKFWHPRMNWYGPTGIGTGRGISGFRNWHQIPFLNAMPDRGQYIDEITYQFIGDGNYAGVTGWPNMIQTITQPGWLGIASTGQKVTMRSLDFWRLEMCDDGKRRIRENWVLVDLLHMYDQIGVDVLARMRELTKARKVSVPDEIWSSA